VRLQSEATRRFRNAVEVVREKQIGENNIAKDLFPRSETQMRRDSEKQRGTENGRTSERQSETGMYTNVSIGRRAFAFGSCSFLRTVIFERYRDIDRREFVPYREFGDLKCFGQIAASFVLPLASRLNVLLLDRPIFSCLGISKRSHR